MIIDSVYPRNLNQIRTHEKFASNKLNFNAQPVHLSPSLCSFISFSELPKHLMTFLTWIMASFVFGQNFVFSSLISFLALFYWLVISLLINFGRIFLFTIQIIAILFYSPNIIIIWIFKADQITFQTLHSDLFLIKILTTMFCFLSNWKRKKELSLRA